MVDVHVYIRGCMFGFLFVTLDRLPDRHSQCLYSIVSVVHRPVRA